MESKDILAYLQGGSVIIAAWVAIYNINAWRRQAIGNKKTEVAEKALIQFYEARDLLVSARSPLSFTSESEKRPRFEGEEEDDRISEVLNGYWVPIGRLTNEPAVALFAELRASRYKFKAYFGDVGESEFMKLFEARNKVIISAKSLVRAHWNNRHREFSESLQRTVERWEADIGWGEEGDDNMTKSINDAVERMEKICQPVLQSGGAGNWLSVKKVHRLFGQ